MVHIRLGADVEPAASAVGFQARRAVGVSFGEPNLGGAGNGPANYATVSRGGPTGPPFFVARAALGDVDDRWYV
jgi:hypothetical protein